MRKMVLACSLLLLLCSTLSFAALVRPDLRVTNDWGPPNQSEKVEIIANLYLSSSPNLVTFTLTGGPGRRGLLRTTFQVEPDSWGLNEVRASADGSIWVINGSEALNVSAGIRVWQGVKWTEVSSSCGDITPSLFRSEVYYSTCNTWPGFWVYRVPTTGVPRYEVYHTLDYITAMDVNPSDGRVAIGESRTIETAGADTPDDYTDDVYVYQTRLIVVDITGQVLTDLGWVESVFPIENLRWSADGTKLAYNRIWEYQTAGADTPDDYTDDVWTWGRSLYETDLTGYGSVIEDDVDAYTYLPNGGYAYSNLVCPTKQDYYARRCFPKSAVTVVGDDTRNTYYVRGNITKMDAYPLQ